MSKRDLVTVVKDLIKSEIEQIHTALPATVVAVKGMDIDVQPSVLLYQNNTHRKLPVIYSVPFMCPSTKSAGIKWNPQVGDNVLLLCCEVSIDNFITNTSSGLVQSEDGRSFDLSDAVAINGFQKQAENTPLAPTDSIQVTGDGQTITIKKNGDIVLGGLGITQALATETFVNTVISAFSGLGVTIPPNVLNTTTKTKAQ